MDLYLHTQTHGLGRPYGPTYMYTFLRAGKAIWTYLLSQSNGVRRQYGPIYIISLKDWEDHMDLPTYTVPWTGKSI